MTVPFKIETHAVEQLADILNKTDLCEIEYEDNGRRIRVVKATQAAMTFSQNAPQQVQNPPLSLAPLSESVVTKAANHAGAIKSPMVGTAYLSSEPGAAPFVKPGDSVSSGQTLMIIEAMKVMNPIKATQSGIVRNVFLKDGQPVEFGEVLMVVE